MQTIERPTIKECKQLPATRKRILSISCTVGLDCTSSGSRKLNPQIMSLHVLRGAKTVKKDTMFERTLVKCIQSTPFVSLFSSFVFVVTGSKRLNQLALRQKVHLTVHA